MQLTRDPPRYSEAYPRIAIGEALRSRRAGTPDLLWRNQSNHAIGVALIDWASPDTVIVSPHIQDLPYVDENEEQFELHLEYKGSTQDNLRPYIVCDGCTRHIDVIIYANDIWRCKVCLRLPNRSTLIDPVVRISEELHEIEQLVGAGRPRNMRMERFQAYERRHAKLLADLRGRPQRNATREYQPRISGEWLPRSSFVTEHMVSRMHEVG